MRKQSGFLSSSLLNDVGREFEKEHRGKQSSIQLNILADPIPPSANPPPT